MIDKGMRNGSKISLVRQCRTFFLFLWPYGNRTCIVCIIQIHQDGVLLGRPLFQVQSGQPSNLKLLSKSLHTIPFGPDDSLALTRQGRGPGPICNLEKGVGDRYECVEKSLFFQQRWYQRSNSARPEKIPGWRNIRNARRNNMQKTNQKTGRLKRGLCSLLAAIMIT